MDFKQTYTRLFQECKQLTLEPKKFWEEQQTEIGSGNIVARFLAPLIILVGAGVLLGEIINNSEFLWSYALMKSAREVISYFLQFYIAVSVLAALLKNYGGTTNINAVRQVLAYSMLPFLVASFITGLFPGLYVFGIVGLYGFYLFVIGAQASLELPGEHRSRYIILAILLILLIFGMINIFSWKLLLAIFPYGA